MTVRQKILFGFTFLILLTGRLCIAGSGYLDDTDEWLYIKIHMLHHSLGHLNTWTTIMNDMQGQPPEILIRALQYISVLPIAKYLHISPLHPDVLYFIGLYNIAVSLLILLVFFKILRRVGFDFNWTLTGVILLGTLFNYNLYTRHILPYDSALLFQLFALYLLLKKDLDNRTIILAGLLSAIGLANYMGEFVLSFINGGVILLRCKSNFVRALKSLLFFAISFFIVFGVLELLTISAHRPYWKEITRYYGTVSDEASLDEGLIYLFLYFYLVEKIWGVFLLALFFIGIYFANKHKTESKIKILLLLGIAAYLVYGSCVYFLHQLPFHGRTLHPFYPFIILGVLECVRHQKVVRQHYALPLIILFAFINYGFVVNDFKSIAYPRSAVYQMGLFDESSEITIDYVNELPEGLCYNNRREKQSVRNELCVDSIGKSKLSYGNYTAVNYLFMKHYPDDFIQTYVPYIKKTRDSVMFEKLHFQSHPAYTLEYCDRNGREFFISKKIKISLIKHN